MIDILQECFKYNRILIYGDGEVGRLLRIYLHEQGIEINGFLTTNEPKQSMLMGVPVYSVNEIKDNGSDTYVIVCMHKVWWQEVSRRLLNLGLSNNIIIDDNLRMEIEKEVLFCDTYDDVERNINVLLYHRIENLSTSYSIMVNEKNFEAQLKYICEHYNVLGCEEEWGNINQKSVALTFDDGYVDFYSKAYPLLKRYNVPATVFVATGGIDNDKEFWWDELEKTLKSRRLPEVLKTKEKEFRVRDYSDRDSLLIDIRNTIIENTYEKREEEISNLKKQMNLKSFNRKAYRTLNVQEIQALAEDPLITIGAHTVNHILCDIEDAETQYKEIKESKLKLESLIDKNVNLFAYPNGNIGVHTREILRKIGFKRAFTCEHACIDRVDKIYDIPRCAVLNWEVGQIERRFRGMWQTSKNI